MPVFWQRAQEVVRGTGGPQIGEHGHCHTAIGAEQPLGGSPSVAQIWKPRGAWS